MDKQAISYSATCTAMLFSAGSSNMYISIGAIVIGVATLVLLNQHYLKRKKWFKFSMAHLSFLDTDA